MEELQFDTYLLQCGENGGNFVKLMSSSIEYIGILSLIVQQVIIGVEIFSKKAKEYKYMA